MLLRVTLFLGALLAAALAGWGVLRSADPTGGQAGIAAQDAVVQVDVLVANTALSAGDVLEEGSLRWQSWPGDAVNAAGWIVRDQHEDALLSLDGSIVRRAFMEAEPIRRDKLAAPDSGFLASVLPQDKRAISVRISAENSAGGFILPNDYVDLIHTRVAAGGPGSAAGSRAETIARNIRVLAIDQTTDAGGSEIWAVGKTATLEVNAEQVELITASEAAGNLYLSLRPAAQSGALAPPEPPIPVVVEAAAPDPAGITDTGQPTAREIRLISVGGARVLPTQVHEEK